MAAPSNRAPLFLALIVALGVGGRLVRERIAAARGAAPPQEALALQLARAERVAREGTGRPSSRGRRGRGAADSAARGSNGKQTSRQAGEGPAPSVVRSERTPIGAIHPKALASYPALVDRTLAVAGGGGGGGVASRDRDRRSRGIETPPPIDVETATATELERLPRIGPALARRIVADRAKRGPFRSLEGLQRVRGVGPVMVRQLTGRVTFGGAGRP